MGPQPQEASTAIVLYSGANMSVQPRGGRPPMHSDDLSDYRIVELEKSKSAHESKLDRIEADWSKKFDEHSKDIVDWKIDTTKAITGLQTTIKIWGSLVIILTPILASLLAFLVIHSTTPQITEKVPEKAIAAHVSNVASQATASTGN